MPLKVEGLVPPLHINLSLASPYFLDNLTSNCSDETLTALDNCSGVGICMWASEADRPFASSSNLSTSPVLDGVCRCGPMWGGANCSEPTRCRFWNTTLGEYSSEGCVHSQSEVNAPCSIRSLVSRGIISAVSIVPLTSSLSRPLVCFWSLLCPPRDQHSTSLCLHRS